MSAPDSVLRRLRLALPWLACALLAACSVAPTRHGTATYTDMLADDEQYSPFVQYFAIDHHHAPSLREEIVLRSIDLIGVDYLFGSRDPRYGLDCSGMVSHVVEQISQRRLPHHAATIAKLTRPIKRGELAPGDLVFFNTLGRRHSHMGVYIGENRFVHAPSPGQKVRIDRLDNRYFAERLDGLHTLMRKID